MRGSGQCGSCATTGNTTVAKLLNTTGMPRAARPSTPDIPLAAHRSLALRDSRRCVRASKSIGRTVPTRSCKLHLGFMTATCPVTSSSAKARLYRRPHFDGERQSMELHQVRYFLAVAATLNFTRAAEQCNVTQPALTKGVQKLEQELGGQLIYRERQLTQLTDLGKEVLPMLERILASAEAARCRAREFQRKEVAPLKIGLAPSISASLVLDPIPGIAKVGPGLHVELREGAAEKLIDLLLEGETTATMVGGMR